MQFIIALPLFKIALSCKQKQEHDRKECEKVVDLREKRTAKGMTQEQLADRVGVVRQMISRIELGLARPSVEVAQAIADVLGFEWTMFFINATQRK